MDNKSNINKNTDSTRFEIDSKVLLCGYFHQYKKAEQIPKDIVDLCLLYCPFHQISSKSASMDSGRSINLLVRLEDTIHEIKSYLIKSKAIKTFDEATKALHLTFDGNVLKDASRISDLNIKANDKMYYSIVNRFKLIIRTVNGSKFEIYTNPNDTILSFKSKIEENQGIPKEGQTLVVPPGKRLSNDKEISEYGLVSDSIVYLVNAFDIHGRDNH